MPKSQHYSRSGYAARRKKSKLPLIIGLVIAALVIIGIAVVFFVLPEQDTTGDVKQGQEIEVVIESGSTTDDIAKSLVNKGVIASANKFKQRVKERDLSSSLQSGSYLLKGGDDLDSIITIISTGQTGRLLVIPEGYTAKQIAKRVEKTCGINADDFYALTLRASDYAADFPFLEGVYNDSLEGFLYPDTYRVDFDATADDVIRTMLKQFAEQIATVNMSYAESKNLTLFDVVTLASMVEKEFKHEEDQALIASVFYNRLHAVIPLGSDVTTYYAVGKDFTEELTLSDLASDSPYNTRNPNHYGLPAGPICNPSVSAINAAANPKETAYMFFFYSNKEGKTMFFENEGDFTSSWAQYGD